MNSTLALAPSQRISRRLVALDVLRGFLILVMALDHANFFISRGKLAPELWANGYPSYGGDWVAFLTRFITHLAAPGFFFLMGMGMTQFRESRRQLGWNRARIAGFFILRGIFLMALQFALENRAWAIGSRPDGPVYFGVLYALGATMILWSFLMFLPGRLRLALSLGLILLIELWLPVDRSGVTAYPVLSRLWLLPGFSPGIYVLYPILPWVGVVGLGLSFGDWLRKDRDAALRYGTVIGLAAILVFITVRTLNGYGNIRPMIGAGWIPFFNVVKYPPAITFLLLTLGTCLILLGSVSAIQWAGHTWLRPLAVFGRVPLFFYLSHLFLYAAMGLWIGGRAVSIPGMLPYWLLGLALLYPACWAFGRFKHGQPANSIWRFL